MRSSTPIYIPRMLRCGNVFATLTETREPVDLVFVVEYFLTIQGENKTRRLRNQGLCPQSNS